MTASLRLQLDGGVAVLTLAEPATRNALSEAMLQALADALARIEADACARCVVIAAEGPAFCAGHDLKAFQAHRGERDYYAGIFTRCAEVMTRIVRLPQPVIAAVEGVATAAGCQLVAACDLAVAGAAARFATPGVNIGLFCSTPAVALTRAVGPKAAMRMLLTGEMIDAATALSMGLVSMVTSEGDALDKAMTWARSIAEKPAHVVQEGKAAVRAQRDLDLDQAYALASGVMIEHMLDPASGEGIAAFLQKRKPDWRQALKACAADPSGPG
ncbi:MAG: enoyl-CoA hydratase [Proteobacteria bacterium]|nr:enoyl-CoA hydratase [Pseudomonadota bacterium]